MYKQFSKFYRNRHLTLGQALNEQNHILKSMEFKVNPNFLKKKKNKKKAQRKALTKLQKWNSQELWARDPEKKRYL